MWAVLLLSQTMARIPIAAAFLAINILVNNTAEPHMIGTANGIGMSMASLGR